MRMTSLKLNVLGLEFELRSRLRVFDGLVSAIPAIVEQLAEGSFKEKLNLIFEELQNASATVAESEEAVKSAQEAVAQSGAPDAAERAFMDARHSPHYNPDAIASMLHHYIGGLAYEYQRRRWSGAEDASPAAKADTTVVDPVAEDMPEADMSGFGSTPLG